MLPALPRDTNRDDSSLERRSVRDECPALLVMFVTSVLRSPRVPFLYGHWYTLFGVLA